MTGGRPLRVLIAGGGTGGHLYPGVAVARELMRRPLPLEVSFVGTADRLEATVVPREGFTLDVIRSAGLKGKRLWGRLVGVWLLPVSLVDAWQVLSRRKPDLVIGVGGYSSGPVVLLAALRRIPTMLLEQNAMPGITNRLLAPFVDAAAVAYEPALAYFRGKGILTGNPVRPAFLAPDGENGEAGRDTDGGRVREDSQVRTVRILVFGGSQGAHAINVAMAGAADRLAADKGYDLVHQTGSRDLDTVQAAYRKAGLEARVQAFLHEMDREMRRADLVVCRAGATTLAELTAAGRPAILIPLPGATDDHQRKNAAVLSRAGAAEVLDQSELTPERLADRVLALVRAPDRRRRMGLAARQLAHPDAAARIADRALALAGAASGS